VWAKFGLFENLAGIAVRTEPIKKQMLATRHVLLCILLAGQSVCVAKGALADSVLPGTLPVRAKPPEEVSSFVQLEAPKPSALPTGLKIEVTPRDPGPDISYTVIEQSLQAMADSLTKITGRGFSVEGDGKVIVRSLKLQGPLHDALDALSSSGGGVIWWSNGLVYKLASATGQTLVSRNMPYADLTETQVMAAIESAFPYRSPAMIRTISGTRMIQLRAPRVVIEELDRSLRASRTQPNTGVTVVRYGVPGK
jgi:hypothetical protein